MKNYGVAARRIEIAREKDDPCSQGRRKSAGDHKGRPYVTSHRSLAATGDTVPKTGQVGSYNRVIKNIDLHNTSFLRKYFENFFVVSTTISVKAMI